MKNQFLGWAIRFAQLGWVLSRYPSNLDSSSQRLAAIVPLAPWPDGSNATATVALDTVYATVGKKPALFRLLIEMAISGTDSEVPVEEREYVRAIRAETDAAGKLRIYAAALRSILQRLAPLFRVLQGAAPLDPELSALWQSISQRRAKNMHLFAADLIATGRLRQHLSVAKTADIIWSMNSPEFYLVEERGWSPKEFEDWLADAWIRLLLEE